MNFNLYIFYKFHCICIIPLVKIHKLSRYKNTIVQILLTSEGSLTRSIEYLTNNIVYIQKSQKESSKLKFQERKIRSVWMSTCLYSRLIFARSLWITVYTKKSKFNKKLSKIPIGKSFIKYELDIHKSIHELYYGYSQLLNIPYNPRSPMWGRKYTLYYKNQYYITIQEFFPDEITYELIK